VDDPFLVAQVKGTTMVGLGKAFWQQFKRGQAHVERGLVYLLLL
jgi:hypothetical protein